MMFERGCLLLIPFPFSDLSATKRRPVLVLTEPDGYGDFIALAVTSKQRHEHSLPLEAPHLASGSLPVSSWVRTDRVVTLNASLVIKSIAVVDRKFLQSAAETSCQQITPPLLH